VRNPIDLALFEGILYWLKAGTGELTSYKLYGPYARRIGKLQLYHYNTEHFAILQSSAQPRGKVFINLTVWNWTHVAGAFSIVCLPFSVFVFVLELSHILWCQLVLRFMEHK
jgi:hypothetical protein